MAEPLRPGQMDELLRDARRHFTSVPAEPEPEAPAPSPEGRPVRMYRGQPIAEPTGGSKRARTYRGAPIADSGAARPSRAGSGATSMVDKLRQLQELRENGVVDEDEFQRLKKALLAD